MPDGHAPLEATIAADARKVADSVAAEKEFAQARGFTLTAADLQMDVNPDTAKAPGGSFHGTDLTLAVGDHNETFSNLDEIGRTRGKNSAEYKLLEAELKRESAAVDAAPRTKEEAEGEARTKASAAEWHAQHFVSGTDPVTGQPTGEETFVPDMPGGE
jgi:hypothetical protein